ncbi:MAG TPA: RNA methyltransferase [Hanamia sp.]
MLSKKIVKYIQSLSHKKFRDESGVFIAEGPKNISEFLLSKNLECKLICAESDWLSENQSLLAEMAKEDIFEADEQQLRSISTQKSPNKVVGVFNKKVVVENPDLSGKISIMLDYLQDPGNMGTIIRIADWFAIENIICSNHTVDCYNPKVVQSTVGSLARVNILYTDLNSFILKNKSINLYATTLHGTSIFELPKIKEGIILIGNEAKGVLGGLIEMSSNQITIPRYGHAESLNAAVATAIIISTFTCR